MKINVRLLPFQHQALTAKERTVCLTCGVGSGKTATVALIAIINMIQGKRVLVIEPTYAQIKDPFFREVEKQMVRYGLMPEGVRIWNLNSKNMKFLSGEILARSAEGGKSAFAGLDGIDTFIIDEAAEIDDFEIFTEGVNRQRKTKFPDEKKTYVVGIGTGEHWFKDIAHRPNTLLLNATYNDNWFLNEADVRDYEEMYGENSIFPKSYIDMHAKGLFVDGNSDSLFTGIALADAAKPGIKTAGYDVAYSGKGDLSVIAVMNGNILERIYTRQTVGDEQIKQFQNYVDAIDRPDYWNYDATGNGIILKGNPINFAGSGGTFANMRTKIYFDLKRMLKEGIHIPEAVKNEHWKTIKQELDATCLRMDKELKKPALIEKQDIRKIIKRSPDRADALALACRPAAPSVDYELINRLQNQKNPFNE
jgi:hypothetical protein